MQMPTSPPELFADRSSPLRILLIEENTEDAVFIQELLKMARRFSFQIIRAASLEESLKLLDHPIPEIILASLSLLEDFNDHPFRRLAQYASDIPIILLTHLDDEMLALQAIREGAQDYLVKTEISSTLLAKTIRHAIERKHFEFNALHDLLTGLPNRALFLDRLERAIQHAKRHAEFVYAILYLDLDRFKVVNDSLGRALGDKLLIACAVKLAGCLRSEDTITRLGGDEFVILLENIHLLQDAVDIAERIQHELSIPISLDQHQVVISASIGIVLGDGTYQRPEDILQDADIAMYQAKSMGKACHVLFEPGMRQQVVRRLQMENDLRQAFENNDLQVHYQPIVTLQTRQLIGFEALLRWRHEQLGPISPKEFIPIAEETGLIHSLGLWVLRQACTQIHSWNTQYNLKPPLTIHVNVSGKQFGQLDFVEKVQQTLNEIGLDPNHLSMEITESLLVEDNRVCNEALARLCSLGIKLHIDDFGTGYSSFAYLQRLPVSSIKIDPTFIMDMKSNTNRAEIVRSIVTLAANLGMNAIAEGVETAEQLAQLKALNCSYGQGFYISEPVPASIGQQLICQSRQVGSSDDQPAG